VFVIGDLGILSDEFVKHLFTAFHPLRVVLLGLVRGDIGCGFVAFSTRWQEDDRGQKVVPSQYANESRRGDFSLARVHLRKV
jgi:hypothetical protein